jgi:Xaa-Pro dipeptidase
MMRVESAVFKGRLADVEAIMAREGVGALVVYALGSVLGTRLRAQGYLRFLCGFDGHNTPAVLVLRPGRDPVLLAATFFLRRLGRELMWFEDVRYVLPPRLASEIGGLLAEAAGAGGRVGIIGLDEIPAPLWEALAGGAGTREWVRFEPFVDPLRYLKDATQLAFHRRAAEICDDLFALFTCEIRKGGKPLYRLQADMEHAARQAGCEHFSSWVTAGPAPDYPRSWKEECDRVPQPGDAVIVTFYALFEGHWGHAVRTGVVGAPSDAQRKAVDVALEMAEAAIAGLAPGCELAAIEAAAEAVFKRHYPDVAPADIFAIKVAHALGHTYFDPLPDDPFVHPYDQGGAASPPAKPVAVQPGMLFEVHPNFFIAGRAAAMVGDMVLVTETGTEILTRHPRDLLAF